jgi:uncharacterized protein with FMN-binding domain
MPKRGAIALALTALALVLLLNFREPAGIDPTGGTGTLDRTGAIAGAPAAGTGSGEVAARTVTGPVVSTRWGDVQVSVTLEGGRLTDVTALQLPDGDRRSASISQRVEPVLRSQALTAQGASIDGISGATYTSIAYARSLQAALDSAGA